MDNSKDLPQVTDESLPEPEIKTQKYRNLSELVADMLAYGCFIEGTAAKFGLSRDTVYRWLETGHFRALVEGKKEKYRLELLKTIQKAGQKEHLWQANAWILERNKVFEDEFKLNQDKGTRSFVVVQIAINHPSVTVTEKVDCDLEK
jgi:transposase